MGKISAPVTPAYSHALGVLKKLRAEGFEALFVGGCVRDWILGGHPKDIDVATNATPDAVEKVFPHTRAVGKSFGVVFVHAQDHPNLFCEVATFRSDGEYHDGRRPESVTFGNQEADAQRRDFTINGIFYDPIDDKIIDHVGGQDDLKAKIIRAIGNPNARFGEDRLRMLRAIRFASRLAFEIDEATMDAIREHAAAISDVSWERINAEFQGMLLQAGRGRAFGLVFDSGLGVHLLPELEAVEAQRFGEMLGMLDMLDGENPNEALAWATLFWPLGADGAKKVCKRLRIGSALSGQVLEILGALDTPNRLHLATLAELKRFLRTEMIEQTLSLYGMRTLLGDGHQQALAFAKKELMHYRAMAQQGNDLLNPAPLINGGDLQELGATPGPLFKQILSAVEEGQLNETIATRAEALEMAKGMLGG